MNHFFKESKEKTSKHGLNACVLTAILLCALLLINLAIDLLPRKIREFDISVDNRYSLTDSAKRTLSKIDKEINIYMLVSGGEDALQDQSFHLSVFLKRMTEYGNDISFSVIDPMTEAELITELNAVNATEGSIIVQSGERTRIISLSSFFYLYIEHVGKVTTEQAQLYLAYYGENVNLKYAFEGENLLLNAITYVTSDDIPTLYILTGHNESEPPSALIESLRYCNIDTKTLELTGTEIPSDCSVLVIHFPSSDISTTEAAMIDSYTKKGGKILLLTGPTYSSKLPNLMKIAESYGLSAEDGIIIDTASNYYYQVPYCLVPSIGHHSSITALAQNNSVMLNLTHGIHISVPLPSGTTVTPLFTTSAESYIVPPDAQSAEKPEGQDAKSHNVGVISEASNGSILVWISSINSTNETYNTYISNGNYTYLGAILSYLGNAPKTIDDTPTFLSIDALDVNIAPKAFISIVLIIIIPVAITTFGFIYWIRRRRK